MVRELVNDEPFTTRFVGIAWLAPKGVRESKRGEEY